MSCTPTRTFQSPIPGVRTMEWYDRSIRSWTVIAVDPKDNQLGDAQYCASKPGLDYCRTAVIDQRGVREYLSDVALNGADGIS